MNAHWTLAAALLLAACNSPPERLCKKAADCAYQGGSEDGEEWSDEDVDDCITLYEDAEEVYEEAGCGDENAAFMKCALKNAECNEDDGELEGVYENCDPELQELSGCLQ